MSNIDQISGNFGFALLPDKRTVEEAYQRATAVAPNHAKYILEPDDLVHITLYHVQVERMPLVEARTVANRLSNELKGQPLTLGSVSSFRRLYIFWSVAKQDRPLLLKCHEQCLRISRFRTPPERVTVAYPDLKLTDEELKNVQRFGHPWVKDLFCPHITLGYGYGHTYRGNSQTEDYEPWLMTVEQIAFVRIGSPARIDDILSVL